MAQYIFENSNELINYVNDINVDSNHFVTQLKITNPEHLNIIATQINFPMALIELINEYVTDNIELSFIRYKYYSSMRLSTRFVLSVNNANINFNTYSFEIEYGIDRNWNKSICKSFACVRFNDKDVLEHNIFQKQHQYIAGDDIDRHNLLKYIFKDPDVYFSDNKCPDDHILRLHLNSSSNKAFFNCYIAEYLPNTIESVNHDNNSSDNKEDKLRELSDCKYYKKEDCYKQITVYEKYATMMQIKVLNHEILMTIINTYNSLYEIMGI